MSFSQLGFQAIHEIYNVHPMFVHFPIAFYPGALLLYLLGRVLRKPFLTGAGRVCLYFGAAGVLLAFATGLAAEESIPHNEAIHEMMETHEALGWIILGITILLTLWSFWQRDSRPAGENLFIVVLGMGVLLILQTADIGSRMVFVEGACVKAAAPLIAPAESKHEHQHSGDGSDHHHEEHAIESPTPAGTVQKEGGDEGGKH